MWKILMYEISDKNGLRDFILGSEEKTSDLAAHFSRNSGAVNTVLFTIQTFNDERTFKDGKIKSTVFTRPHAMKRHKSMSPIVKEWDS